MAPRYVAHLCRPEPVRGYLQLERYINNLLTYLLTYKGGGRRRR